MTNYGSSLKSSLRLQAEYAANPKRCKGCAEPLAYSKRHANIFCGHHCAVIWSNSRRKSRAALRNCQQCGCEYVVQKGSRGKYCSVQCGNKARETDVGRWLSGEMSGSTPYGKLVSGIRKYLIESSGYACQQCGWDKLNPYTGKSPLEIHHVDGDWKNNQPDNLAVLCPSCHSLTESYGNLNRGRGRTYR